jgi:hypothetical protein
VVCGLIPSPSSKQDANEHSYISSLSSLSLCSFATYYGKTFAFTLPKKTLKRTFNHSKSQNLPLYKDVVLQHQHSSVVTVHCSAPSITTNTETLLYDHKYHIVLSEFISGKRYYLILAKYLVPFRRIIYALNRNGESIICVHLRKR